jgi:RimJ/RimL family protein N-acetyltransferase
MTPAVRHVRGHEAARLRGLRLRALATDPGSFAATLARDEAKPEAWWHAWAAQSEAGAVQRTYVITGDADRWLGLALVRRDEARPGGAVLHAMWVAPEARGAGATRALCDACAAWAAGQGLGEMTLTVLADNEQAQRAYAAAGFAVTGTTTWSEHGGAVDRLVSGDAAAGPGDGHDHPELVMTRPL